MQAQKLTRQDTRWEEARALFNRYLLPKAAFAIITLASAVGVHLAVDGTGPLTAAAVAHWLFLISLGLLSGALVWNVFYAEPASRLVDDPEADHYLQRQRRVFRRREGWLLPLLLLSGVLDLVLRSGAGRHPAYEPVWQASLVLLLVVAAVELLALGRRATPRLGLLDILGMAAAVLLLLVSGWLEVLPRVGLNPLQMGVRSFHLLAFGLWYGGAFWNIFVAVPAAGSAAGYPVVATANLQLERFRWVVRGVFPTIVLTGLLQAYAYFGLDWRALLATSFGQWVLVKLGLIITLIGIFITCPMWRACSPIRGVCNIEDLAETPASALGMNADNLRLHTSD